MGVDLNLESASPNLYHLHAAKVALLPDPTSSTSSSPFPLPRLSSYHSRSLLLQLEAQAQDDSSFAASSTYRTPLWYAEQEQRLERSAGSAGQSPTEAGRLSRSLASLPENWRLQNAFCSRCAGLVIPGITASSLIHVDGEKRPGARDRPKPERLTAARGVDVPSRRPRKSFKGSTAHVPSSDGPPLVCLLCLSPGTLQGIPGSSIRPGHPRKLPALSIERAKSYLPMTMQEKRAKKESQAKFPSVRRREIAEVRGPGSKSVATTMRGLGATGKGTEGSRKRKQAQGRDQGRTLDIPVEPLPPDRDQAQTEAAVAASQRVTGGSNDQTRNMARGPSSLEVAHTSSIVDAGRDQEDTSDPINSASDSTPSSAPRPSSIPQAQKLASARATQPPIPTPAPAPPSAHKRQERNQKDHKSALRAMLAKGATEKRRKEGGGGVGEGGKGSSAAGGPIVGAGAKGGAGGGGGGGGGLRDFLAGL